MLGWGEGVIGGRGTKLRTLGNEENKEDNKNITRKLLTSRSEVLTVWLTSMWKVYKGGGGFVD